MGTRKIYEHLFGNTIANECNSILDSCKTKEDRMRAATLIRSKINIDFPTQIFLKKGINGYLY